MLRSNENAFHCAVILLVNLQQMGFNRATYYSIKTGNSISTNTVEQLCRLLHCRVEDVLVYVEDSEESSDNEEK